MGYSIVYNNFEGMKTLLMIDDDHNIINYFII